MAAEKDTEKPTEKPSEKSTPEVDEKTYGTFKAMMTKFINDREEEESKTPARTKASEEKPRPSVLQTLFGGE